MKVVKPDSKNWITHGSEEGARASALMYRLLETAKMYGLNPRDYLSYVFMKGAVSAKVGNLAGRCLSLSCLGT